MLSEWPASLSQSDASGAPSPKLKAQPCADQAEHHQRPAGLEGSGHEISAVGSLQAASFVVLSLLVASGCC